MSQSRKCDLEAAARLALPRDSLLCGFVAGQPVGFLEALGDNPFLRMQYDVTEHGAVDLSALGDDERPVALIELAHFDFRDSLRAALAAREA